MWCRFHSRHPAIRQVRLELQDLRGILCGLPKFIARTELPVVVDFWAEWCGPCKSMAPNFTRVARQMPEVRFAKVDCDAAPGASALYNIRSIPTLTLFTNGGEVARLSGAVPATQLATWLKQHLQSDAARRN